MAFFPCFVRNTSSISRLHETLTKKSFLGLERNFCSEKKVKTVVPEVPITWMYNAFVWKMHAQISGLPNSEQHLQQAAPHSSLMLGNQVIDYSARKDVILGFMWNERKKKRKQQYHLIVLISNRNILKSCFFFWRGFKSAGLLFTVLQVSVFRPWVREWI